MPHASAILTTDKYCAGMEEDGWWYCSAQLSQGVGGARHCSLQLGRAVHNDLRPRVIVLVPWGRRRCPGAHLRRGRIRVRALLLLLCLVDTLLLLLLRCLLFLAEAEGRARRASVVGEWAERAAQSVMRVESNEDTRTRGAMKQQHRVGGSGTREQLATTLKSRIYRLPRCRVDPTIARGCPCVTVSYLFFGAMLRVWVCGNWGTGRAFTAHPAVAPKRPLCAPFDCVASSSRVGSLTTRGGSDDHPTRC